MKTTILIFICLNLSGQVLGQTLKRDTTLWTSYGYIKKEIINEDTVIFNQKTEEYLIVTKKGVKVLEGRLQTGIGQKCGHEAKKNGLWIERYETGKLLSVGSYDCGFRIGEWIFFYQNGNKQKIENYSKSYHDTNSIFNLSTFLNGNYLEFYENGSLKTYGNYDIKIVNDTVTYVYPDPPYLVEDRVGIQPVSYKSGTWYFYNSNGTLLKKEEHEN